MISVLKNKLNKKGFTLAELLVVVAIIGVLIAIAVPVFNSSTKKAQEAVEVANARSVYAEGMVAVVDGSYKDKVERTYDGVKYTFTYTTGTPDTWKIAIDGGINDNICGKVATGSGFDKVVIDGNKDTTVADYVNVTT